MNHVIGQYFLYLKIKKKKKFINHKILENDTININIINVKLDIFLFPSVFYFCVTLHKSQYIKNECKYYDIETERYNYVHHR